MATGRIVAGIAGKPTQTPFYKDPNIWTLLGVLAVQVTAAALIWYTNPLYLLLNMTDVAFPFAAYERFITLPGVIVAAVIAFFIFAAVVRGMGERGKKIVRWTTLVLALGSAATVVAQAWQI